ncbi:LytR family transcriptional attenuator [Tumebacillus sp. BK434]|uniref:LCP family protein n=1 Tax=Tumebacillus sp. BK434 TaxID=2512169 RepID=UPI0010ECA04D|nr:LCP family protein [Tumebacillus sp. BK434]TCP55631.1 LytR family transcriptional attenuator [Tumebacillus sp. BK434]
MKKKWLRLVGFVLTVLLLFAGYYVYSMFSFLDAVSTTKFSTGDSPLTTATWEGKEQVNILFLGVDSRVKGERPRSDTILLLSVNPVTKKASLFSIMRDTYLDIEGVGQAKINAAFANGGPELLISTVQEFLDIPIHYYVATDFQGFAKIIDAIGGVDVNVAERMVHADDGIHDILLEAGKQHLSGEQALMYVRYRGTARADFDRTERQREMVKIVGQKMSSPGMALKLPKILKEITPYTQSNIAAGDLYKLIALGLQADTSGMQTEQLPPVEFLSEEYNMYGEQVLWPDIAATRQFVHEKIGATKSAESPAKTADSSTGTAASSGNGQGQGQQQSNVGNPSDSGKQKGQVTGEYVNLRQKPGTENEVIGQVYAGEVLVIEETAGDWYYVRTPDGMYGYVAASLVQLL